MSQKAILIMMTDVPAELEAQYHTWYNEVHLPELLSIPGIQSARRFRLQGEGIRFMALYELDHAGVLSSDAFLAWKANSESTRYWSERFSATQRLVYEQIYPVT